MMEDNPEKPRELDNGAHQPGVMEWLTRCPFKVTNCLRMVLVAKHAHRHLEISDKAISIANLIMYEKMVKCYYLSQ